MSEISSLVIEKIKKGNNTKEDVIIVSIGFVCITIYHIAKECEINIKNKIFINKRND